LFTRGCFWIWVLNEESAAQLQLIDLVLQIPEPACLKSPHSPLQFFEQVFVTRCVHALIPLNQAAFFLPVFGSGDKTMWNQTFDLFFGSIVGNIQDARRRRAERQVTQSAVSHASGPSAVQCTGIWRAHVVRVIRRAGVLLKRVVVLVVRQQIRKVDERLPKMELLVKAEGISTDAYQRLKPFVDLVLDWHLDMVVRFTVSDDLRASMPVGLH